ncbi:glycosyltransferase family 2 protein [Salegentibacter sp. F14]
MDKSLSIIYAFRDRDVERVKLSMESLRNQKSQNFEVIFVDYGSDSETSNKVQKALESFEFCNYSYLHTSQRLWNKSRALNYGIKRAKNPYIFIADVDLIFSPVATKFLENNISKDSFKIFKLAYLDEQASVDIDRNKNFKDLKATRTGEINGMILARKEAFYEISGYDEFYHFYGSEDVDLYARLKNAGFIEKRTEQIHFYHNWHPSYQNSEQGKLTIIPRLKNAMRINEQHYLNSLKNKVIEPNSQVFWGEAFEKSNADKLKSPDVKIELENIEAAVEHFIFEGIKFYKNKIVEVKIYEADYYTGLKYKIKKRLGKQSQTYISLKKVNDIILKRIIFEFRNHNYSYKITADLKNIVFKIEL